MENTIIYNKLVRDKIPQIIESGGNLCDTEILPQDAYVQKLEEKLQEELTEYLQSKEQEELADLLEVLQALVKARDLSWEELEEIQTKKREKRGGFDQRILLKTVTER